MLSGIEVIGERIELFEHLMKALHVGEIDRTLREMVKRMGLI